MMRHINNLLNDNDGSLDFGHRRHLLHPGYAEFGYGITESFAEVNLNGYQDYKYIFNGWPAPNGITFMESLTYRKFIWSVAFDRSKYLVQNSCTAEIKCLNTGEKYIFNEEEGEADSNRIYQNIVEGEQIDSLINKVVIRDNNIEPVAGYAYEVTIHGLKNVRTGKIEDYTYRVRFDYADAASYGNLPTGITIEPDAKLEKLSNTNNTYSAKVGETYKLNAILEGIDENVIERKITWESSNPELVTVKQDGTIKINKDTNDKSATITVYLDANKSIQEEIIIKPQDVTLILDTENYTFTSLDDTLQLSPHLSNNEETTFTYKSSNENILKVDKNGVVKPTAPGFADVSITDTKYNKSVICRFYVATLVTLSDGSKAYVGDMNRDGMFNSVDSSLIIGAYNRTPTEDEALIGDVSGDGYLNAVDSSIILKLFSEDVFSPGKYFPITSVKLSKNELTLQPNKSETLKATIEPKNTTDSPKITWKSSDEGIAKVDENGKITAIAKGSTEIVATSTNGKEDKCTVTVAENTDKPQTLKGDVNGNGIVELTDYSMILKHVKGIKLLEGEQLKRADVNENGTIELTDYSMVLKHVKGIKLLF